MPMKKKKDYPVPLVPYYCSLCDNHNIVAEISDGQRSNYYFHI